MNDSVYVPSLDFDMFRLTSYTPRRYVRLAGTNKIGTKILEKGSYARVKWFKCIDSDKRFENDFSYVKLDDLEEYIEPCELAYAQEVKARNEQREKDTIQFRSICAKLTDEEVLFLTRYLNTQAIG